MKIYTSLDSFFINGYRIFIVSSEIMPIRGDVVIIDSNPYRVKDCAGMISGCFGGQSESSHFGIRVENGDN